MAAPRKPPLILLVPCLCLLAPLRVAPMLGAIPLPREHAGWGRGAAVKVAGPQHGAHDIRKLRGYVVSRSATGDQPCAVNGPASSVTRDSPPAALATDASSDSPPTCQRCDAEAVVGLVQPADGLWVRLLCQGCHGSEATGLEALGLSGRLSLIHI